MPNKQIIITEEVNGMRLDKALAFLIPERSRQSIINDLDKQLITVNDKNLKRSYKVETGDVIELAPLEVVKLDLTPVKMDLDILHEDSDMLVVYKPEGLVVHPAPSVKEPTLVNGLLYQVKGLAGINGTERPGIVHRIDKDTSGLLMVAKTELAQLSLSKQLAAHTVTRIYYAIVYGKIEENSGKIDAPIGRDKYDRKKMAVVEGGKSAVTNFKVIKRFRDYTYIECKLETGRTHQIRVHLKYIGHPLLGDAAYGPKKAIGETGQYLHAGVIGFNHPRTDEYMEFRSPVPKYFLDKLDDLEKFNKLNVKLK